MKKRVLILFFALTFGFTSLSAVGIGIQGGADIGENSGGGLAVTFKLDTTPWVFAVNARISSASFGIGVSADQWLLDNQIVGLLNWFVGWGVYGNLLITDPVGFGIGARLPIGIHMYFADGFVEPYLQIAPSIGVDFYESLGFDWSIPVNLGIRFWI